VGLGEEVGGRASRGGAEAGRTQRRGLEEEFHAEAQRAQSFYGKFKFSVPVALSIVVLGVKLH
jgi:hypothetical protein